MSNARFGLRTRTGQVSDIVQYRSAKDYLLDNYPNAAAAYSLRLLRNEYAGSAIRVRRSNDNAEQDIAFDNSGNLDTSALTTFVGGNNGFVTIWYDQSGNANHATQTTSANQPKIYDSSSTVITENGKPAMTFDGSNDTLRCGAAFTEVSYISAVYENNDTATFRTILGADATLTSYGSFYFQSSRGTIRLGGFARKSATNPASNYEVQMTSPVAAGAQVLQTGYITGSTLAVAQNGTLQTTSINTGDLTVIGGAQSGQAEIGAGYFGNNLVDISNIKLQELIVYSSNQSANRADIETNINEYYAIY